MQDSSNSNSGKDTNSSKKEYDFGGIQEYSLEKIEDEILNESLYLDVFAGSDIAFKENINYLENILPALMISDALLIITNLMSLPTKASPKISN